MKGDATPGLVGRLRAALDLIDAASRWMIVAAMAGMALLISAQGFQRYVMSASIDAADELSRLFFVWAISLAIPHGIRRGIHVGIDVFARMTPPRAQDALQRVSAAAGLEVWRPRSSPPGSRPRTSVAG